MDYIEIPISFGELLDKISILEIKMARIKAADKLANVKRELDLLNATWRKHVAAQTDIRDEYAKLKKVNELLWDIEDAIRIKEKAQAFDDEFVRLARSVYVRNDERADAKKALNLKLGSSLVEEKSYEDYR